MDEPTLRFGQPLTYVKAIYATVIGFLGSLVTVMVGVGFEGVEPGQWVAATLAGLIAGGGVLGLTNQPVK
jgi:hypothetical protein